MSFFGRLLRAGEGRKVKALASIVPEINALEPEVSALSDDDLRHRTVEFREQLDRADDVDEALNELLIPAFAVCREASKRVLGQRHYDVQLMGGAALHFGWIAEMKTGEGKTLVATLPLYLNGLTRRGAHLVTVNDYLATFQQEWMGRLYGWLGLSCGLVIPGRDDAATKRAAYAADITYGTNNEFGFDYLRDNMRVTRDQMTQRGHVYAIVDEVDSILIDEARTPLIISAPSNEAARLYNQFAAIARGLKRDVDYEVDEEKRTVAITEDGIDSVERALGVENLYDQVTHNLVHHLQKSLQAKELYKRDKDYVVIDREVKIVDEFTGRIMEGRRWGDGLHQAVEAKERVPIREENHTVATVTLQNYFRLYSKLAGMTGTAETEAGEFASTYSLPVVPIPTHRPMVRADQPDVVYKTEAAKFAAVVEDVAERFERGQPVLVGTASVAKSEVLSRLFEKRGIQHNVLNAKQHAREAAIIAQAGRLHAVTVATNMAGRGVDILLGGNPELLAADELRAQGLQRGTEEWDARWPEVLRTFEASCAAEGDKVRELGGLYVLGSERHESRRIDNQLRGRSGRQGDPGESRFFLSLEDELMRLFATGLVSRVMGAAFPDDVPLEARMVTKAIERAQTSVEQRNAEIRKEVLKYDEVMNEQRKVIYARRLQVIDGEDLRDRTFELLDDAIERVVDTFCATEFPEDWDLDGLISEITTIYPTRFTAAELGQAATKGEVLESLSAEAETIYEERERSLPGGEEMARDLERRIMLSIIDQRWRDHLAEMDYLRDGIGLRAAGQKDPLLEWQREAYEAFGNLMTAIDEDYVRYVMHVSVQIDKPEEPDLERATFTAADDPVQGTGAVQTAAVAEAAAQGATGIASDAGSPTGGLGGPSPSAPQASGPHAVGSGEVEPHAPIVKADHEKLGRNDPCHCGSGQKFKNCHGR